MTSKRIITTIIVGLISLAFVGMGIVYGWFLNQSETDGINADTKGIVFSYTVSDGDTTSTNVTSYNVYNVTFFDIDDEGEGYYFADMACELTFVVTNVCEDNLTLTLTYTPDQDTTGPYLGGLITTTQITDTTACSTVEDVCDEYMAGTSADTVTLDTAIEPEATATVYLYIYGIQPDDAADNTFFNDSYGFSLELKAVKEASE